MKQERQLGQAAWIGVCDHQCEVFWDSWDRMEQLEIVFVPLLIPVVVRESLLSFWPSQELFSGLMQPEKLLGALQEVGFQACSQPSLRSGTTLDMGWNLVSVVMVFTNRKNPGAK